MNYLKSLTLGGFLALANFSFAEEINKEYLDKYFNCLKRCHNDRIIRLIKQEIGYSDPKGSTLFLNFKLLNKLCESKEKEECMDECHKPFEEDILNLIDLNASAIHYSEN